MSSFFSSSASLPPPTSAVHDPMDWQPTTTTTNIAVAAWTYQQVTLPALVAAGGPFSLPPLYAYYPAPIVWEGTIAHHHLLTHGGAALDFRLLELEIERVRGEKLCAAVRADEEFLARRERLALERCVETVLYQLQEQMDVQKKKERIGVLMRMQRDQLAAKQQQQLAAAAPPATALANFGSSLSSSSLSSFSSSGSSLFSSSSSSSASTSSSSTSFPTPTPTQVMPGVADQGSAFRSGGALSLPAPVKKSNFFG